MQSNSLEKKADQLLCVRKEALGTRLMPKKTMVRRCVIGNTLNSFKRVAYIGNSAISLLKIIDINLRTQPCSGHYVFHNSVSLNRLQLPVLNSHLLYQASLPYVEFSDCCHSAHELD